MLPLLLATLTPTVNADEGMWLPDQLTAESSAFSDLDVPVKELADWRGGPLGAVADLGHCSASFVSSEGLLITNGHCVRSFLRYGSLGRGDLVHDGYLAKSRDEELWAGPGARVYIVEQVTDVTEQVLSSVKRRSDDAARWQSIQRSRKELVAECEADGGHRCQVASFYGGLEYRLIAERELRDLRVVYAPPESVVFFGGDADNWMWPRHSGDVAFLRAYASPDGTGTAYSDENVPFKPESSLKISTAGISTGDFVLQGGYPGITYRNRTASEISYAATRKYPDDLEIMGAMLDILRDHASAGPSAAQRVQNQIFSLANRAKYLEGMIDGLEKTDIIARKDYEAKALADWIAADRTRTRSYAEALTELESVISETQGDTERDRLLALTSRYARLLGAVRKAYRYTVESEKSDLDRMTGYQGRDLDELKADLLELDWTLHLEADRDITRLLLERIWRLGAEHRGSPVHGWISASGGVENAIDRLYRSIPELATGESRVALLGKTPADLESSRDPWVSLAIAFEQWVNELQTETDARSGALSRLRPVYMQAQRQMQPGFVYPDANGTLRVSVGRVVGYAPAEAVDYHPHTTVDGLAAKSGRAPFTAPEWLLQEIEEAASSPWADETLGSVPANFLTNLDSTGGNSGSPTLNAKGELIGLVFDRNYEAMAADWAFGPDLTRSIHVDIRMGLWLLSATDGGEALIKELGVGGG